MELFLRVYFKGGRSMVKVKLLILKEVILLKVSLNSVRSTDLGWRREKVKYIRVIFIKANDLGKEN